MKFPDAKTNTSGTIRHKLNRRWQLKPNESLYESHLLKQILYKFIAGRNYWNCKTSLGTVLFAATIASDKKELGRRRSFSSGTLSLDSASSELVGIVSVEDIAIMALFLSRIKV